MRTQRYPLFTLAIALTLVGSLNACDNCKWKNQTLRLEQELRSAIASRAGKARIDEIAKELANARAHYVTELSKDIGIDGVEREFMIFADGKCLQVGGLPLDLEDTANRTSPFVDYSPPGVKRGDPNWGTYIDGKEWRWFYRRVEQGDLLRPNRLGANDLPPWFVDERRAARRAIAGDAARTTSDAAPSVHVLQATEFQLDKGMLLRDGSFVIGSGDTDQNLRYGKLVVWDASTGKIHSEIRIPATGNKSWQPCVSPDGKSILVGTGYKNDYEMWIWNVNKKCIVARVKPKRSLAAADCEFSVDGKFIRFGSDILDLSGQVVATGSNWEQAHWTVDNRLVRGDMDIDNEEIEVIDPFGDQQTIVVQDEERRYSGWALLGDQSTILAVLPRNGREYLQYIESRTGRLIREVDAPPGGPWRFGDRSGNGYHVYHSFGQNLLLPFAAGQDVLFDSNRFAPSELRRDAKNSGKSLFDQMLEAANDIALSANPSNRPDYDYGSHGPILVGGSDHFLVCYKDWPQFKHYQQTLWVARVNRADFSVTQKLNLTKALKDLGQDLSAPNFVPQSIRLADDGRGAYIKLSHGGHGHSKLPLVIRFTPGKEEEQP